MRRFCSGAVILAFLFAVPTAAAWTWPADGPVLRSFSLGPDAYAAGQHRGVDIGAEVGAQVLAPVSGTVSFAGAVPGGGRAITIQTPDGYAVTLLQLGAAAVASGDTVVEGAAVGIVGESADGVTTQPHVHLGVRVVADANGYVDPLGLLPARVAAAPPEQGPQPAATPEPIQELPVAQAPAVAVSAPASNELQPEPTVPVVEPAAVPARPRVVVAVAPAPAETRAAVRRAVVPGPEVAPTSPAGHPAQPARESAVRSSAIPSPVRRTGATLRALARPEVAPTRVLRPVRRPVAAAREDAGTTPPPDGEIRDTRRVGPSPVTAATRQQEQPPTLLGVVTLLAVLAAAVLGVARAVAGALEPARIMGADAREDPGCGRVAVCERPAAHRSRGGLRGPVRHLRSLPPAPRQRRADGERHRRARDAGDGGRRRGRRLAA
jgi:hypothetical protein